MTADFVNFGQKDQAILLKLLFLLMMYEETSNELLRLDHVLLFRQIGLCNHIRALGEGFLEDLKYFYPDAPLPRHLLLLNLAQLFKQSF